MKRFLSIALVAWLIAAFGSLSQAQSSSVDYQRDVLPILQERCFDCHSEGNAESNLRLDSVVETLRGGDSGEATVKPGDPAGSYLIARITTENSNERMPPEADPLPQAEVDVLRAWIEEQSHWTEAAAQLAQRDLTHWSFQPLGSPVVPRPSKTHLDQREGVPPARNEIDAFIDQALLDKQLTRSSQASKRQLVRRLYLVMHGLPPTETQVQRFLDDTRENAWELLVEEVLESPRYGERLATMWLDLARFGETHGFETNRERPHAWRFRDWVIDSFNNDKPFDQFVRQQIAGDALGEPIGTGFLVAGPYDLVKGQDPLLSLVQRQDELADMINATGTAFLGLTLGCARCHNHKFDPVSQTDYYSLQAIFAGVNHSDRSLPQSNEELQQVRSLEEQISQVEDQLTLYRSPYVEEAKQDTNAAPQPLPLRVAVNSRGNEEHFEPVLAKLVRFTIVRTNQSEPCIDELEIFSGSRNVALAKHGGVARSSGDFVHPLHKLEHINDGRHGNSRSWIASATENGWVEIEFPSAQEIDRIVWARDREGQFADRLAIDYRIESSLDGQQWAVIASSEDRQPFDAGPGVEPKYYFETFPESAAIRGRELLARLSELKAAHAAVSTPPMAYAGTFSQPGPTHRLYRGEPTAKREEVAPGAISALVDLSLTAATPEQERRMQLADWIASKDNPLTARVIVNRIWQQHFGTGIVDTPSDFGANGTAPTHPELLDYLASELIQSGWSLKQLNRKILLSSTWQQDSRPRPQGMAVDSGSRYLWRFPARRLEAEAIRDCILAVTDKLDLRYGGPGFSAFEVDMENVRHYHPKSVYGPEDWRRMIYMTRVRQEKDAVFGVFDCPDYSQVVPKRSRSTTPLQALNLLNSPFVLQQAKFLVERLEASEETAEGRIRLAFRLCFAREAEPDEIASSLQFINDTNWTQFARVLLNTNEFLFVP